jgi:hypothetical protein
MESGSQFANMKADDRLRTLAAVWTIVIVTRPWQIFPGRSRACFVRRIHLVWCFVQFYRVSGSDSYKINFEELRTRNFKGKEFLLVKM